MRRAYDIEVDCADCARKVEWAIQRVEGVNSVTVAFVDKRMYIDIDDDRFDEVMERVAEAARTAEEDFVFRPRTGEDGGEEEGGHAVVRIAAGLVFVVIGLVLEHLWMPDIPETAVRAVFLVALLAIGSQVFVNAVRNLAKGGVLAEHFLM